MTAGMRDRETVRATLVDVGVLPVLVLTAIDAGMDYSYAIRRWLKGELMVIGEGTLYTALKRYEAKGLVTSTGHNENPRIRRRYALTERGRLMLPIWQEEWRDISRLLADA